MNKLGKPSPALVISLIALFVALGGAGIAATGDNFVLGQANTASTRTQLSSGVANGTLDVYNTSTTAPSTPLRLTAATGRPPMVVNSKVRVDNLTADYLDGLDSSAFLRKKLPLTLAGSVAGDGIVHATNSNAAGYGLYGENSAGGVGVLGRSVGGGLAGYFDGTLVINGALSCGGCVSAGDLAPDENWHYIGDPGEPQFENGWVNYDAHTAHTQATYQHAAYYKDRNGWVHLGGLIKNGAFGSAFSLHGQALCPYYYRIFAVQGGNVLGRITVSFDTGTGCHVQVDGGNPNVWISLDGVQWRAWSSGDATKPDLGAPNRTPTPLP